jgi:hypothetical protein
MEECTVAALNDDRGPWPQVRTRREPHRVSHPPPRNGHRLRQLGNAGDRADDRGGLERHENDLAVVGRSDLAERLDVVRRDEVIERLDVARRDRFGDDARGRCFGLGLPLPRAGVER